MLYRLASTPDRKKSLNAIPSESIQMPTLTEDAENLVPVFMSTTSHFLRFVPEAEVSL